MNAPVSIKAELTALFEAQQKSIPAAPAGAMDELRAMFSDKDLSRLKATKERKARRERNERGEFFTPKNDDERKAARQATLERQRKKKLDDRLTYLAVLDMETDPFDHETLDPKTGKPYRIDPFTCCLYSEQFGAIEIWDDDPQSFVEKVVAAVEALPNKYTIYAHNGGKFDFLFFIHKLRGFTQFKGRGVMAAKIGNHELRDSYHIIPEKLAAYRKDQFDYTWLTKANRHTRREAILDYQRNDCIYLYDIVKSFLKTYGFKMSIGSAAIGLLKKEYPECERIGPSQDQYLRDFFFGGRVECIQGRGQWKGDFKLYDVNSMYPYVMARKKHPISKTYIPRKGEPNANTCFMDLWCYSHGAFPVKVEGVGTEFPHAFGRYKVTIHEYEVAIKYNLISRVRINYCIDNPVMTDFSKFIEPLYNLRQVVKAQIKEFARLGGELSEEYLQAKKDDIFLKLLMNNAYGRFAINPRRFKEYFLTDPDKAPEQDRESWGQFPDTQNSDFAIWARPTLKVNFENVGTAASITGAARAQLLEAMQNAIDPVYCDTDSLICREMKQVELHPTNLGAWDCEAEIDEIIICGKKLYAYRGEKIKSVVIKSKGTSGITWKQMEQLLTGEELLVPAKAPTLTKGGSQAYIPRRIKATASPKGN
jgi:predicted RNA-binding protein YlxR (DUF448 family)